MFDNSSATLDLFKDGLTPGRVMCIAGRPSVGKTALLLQIACELRRLHNTDVVFATAQRFTTELIALLPPEERCHLTEVLPLDLMRGEVGELQTTETRIYLLDTRLVGRRWPTYLAYYLNKHGPHGCGLLVSDGWTVYRDRVTTIEHRIGKSLIKLPWERAAAMLPARVLARMLARTTTSGIATLLGIRTASDDPTAGPRASDLLDLYQPLENAAVPIMLLHRPSLYLPHGFDIPSDCDRVELSRQFLEGRSRAITYLQYDREQRRFRRC